MVRENGSWGYTRIRGALYHLGHDVARNTSKNNLAENGLEPAPERGRHTNWHTFINAHLGTIAGADFYTAEVLLQPIPIRAKVASDGASVLVEC
jgi:putative transposase